MHFLEQKHFLREARFSFTILGTKRYSVAIVVVCFPFKCNFTIVLELKKTLHESVHMSKG